MLSSYNIYYCTSLLICCSLPTNKIADNIVTIAPLKCQREVVELESNCQLTIVWLTKWRNEDLQLLTGSLKLPDDFCENI